MGGYDRCSVRARRLRAASGQKRHSFTKPIDGLPQEQVDAADEARERQAEATHGVVEVQTEQARACTRQIDDRAASSKARGCSARSFAGY